MSRMAILVAMSILASHAAALERHNLAQMSGEAVGRVLQSERRSLPAKDGLYRVLRCTKVTKSFSRR